jgi:hypothetical protein
MRVQLVVAFRELSWRRPLRDPTVIQVFNPDTGQEITRLPVSILEAMVRTHLEMADTQAQIHEALHPPPPPPPDPLPAPAIDPAPPPPAPAPEGARYASPPQRRLRGVNGRRLRGLGP